MEEASGRPGPARPLFSVVVPCYNVEDYLAQCLESICAQTCGDYELICINDGSSDGTAELLNDYASRDGRLVVLNQDNAGVSAARNRGLACARGRYTVFVDGDDWVDPALLEQVAAARCKSAGPGEDAPADIVVFGGTSTPGVAWVDEVMDTRDLVHPCRPGETGFDILFTERGCIPLMCNKAYRTEFLREQDARFDEDLAVGEDNAFQCLLFPEAKKVVFLAARLYHYRCGREGSAVSLSSALPLDKLCGHVDLLRSVFDRWNERAYPKEVFCRLLDAQAFLFNEADDLNPTDMVAFCTKLNETLADELEACVARRDIESPTRLRYRYFADLAFFGSRDSPERAVRKAKRRRRRDRAPFVLRRLWALFR